MKTGQDVSQDRRDQITGLLATCNNFLNLDPYGNCDMCKAAISNLMPYCDRNESEECKGACKVSAQAFFLLYSLQLGGVQAADTSPSF